MRATHRPISDLVSALLSALLIGSFSPIPASAQETAKAGMRLAAAPKPAKGEGDKCVAPTEWMRRYHMTVLDHQRDKTVHTGVRAGPFDLKGCIACHVVEGSDGRAVTVADPKHFCRTCHDYAAVKVDCFECHASRPQEEQKSSHRSDEHDIAELEGYLKGKAP